MGDPWSRSDGVPPGEQQEAPPPRLPPRRAVSRRESLGRRGHRGSIVNFSVYQHGQGDAEGGARHPAAAGAADAGPADGESAEGNVLRRPGPAHPSGRDVSS